ncbi:MAG: DUF3784 domain-containing protein, partial [Pseudomonadales bacterium]
MNVESEATIRLVMLWFGFLLAAVFIVPGLLVERYKRYNLIAGYNRASRSEQARYDMQRLAKHVGNGLETLGVLICVAGVLGYFGLDGWAAVTMAIFVLIAFIIPIGARKFMPRQRRMKIDSPADAMHPFLHWALPARMYAAAERGTRKWAIECGVCKHTRDYWDAGGVRGGGVGEPRVWFACPACDAGHWHKVRKKTRQE